jgi:hypothetical protein
MDIFKQRLQELFDKKIVDAVKLKRKPTKKVQLEGSINTIDTSASASASASASDPSDGWIDNTLKGLLKSNSKGK